MKKIAFILFIGLFALLLTACGSSESQDSDGSNADGDAAADKAETITVEHELGKTDVTKNPEKIIVFDFGALDTLDKLGIEVAGVPQSGVVPPYLEKYASEDYENVGSLKEPDFEKIAEIDPDLIIISGRQSEVYDQLQELGPTVYLGVDPTRYMDSFKENLAVIGEIFDKKAKVDEEFAKMEDSITTLNEKASESGANALIILANDDKISAYGPNSRFGLIHDVFGIPPVDKNIEVATHGRNVSFEYVVEQDPDMLYVVDRSAVVGGDTSAKQLVENDLVKNTKAYKNDNIIYLDPNYWYLSGGGLVSVSEMINEISDSLK